MNGEIDVLLEELDTAELYEIDARADISEIRSDLPERAAAAIRRLRTRIAELENRNSV